MKLVFKTTADKRYVVRLPNYFNVEETAQLLVDIRLDLAHNEDIVEHHFYGDNMPTLEERKEIDCYGEIRNHPIELQVQL